MLFAVVLRICLFEGDSGMQPIKMLHVSASLAGSALRILPRRRAVHANLQEIRGNPQRQDQGRIGSKD